MSHKAKKEELKVPGKMWAANPPRLPRPCIHNEKCDETQNNNDDPPPEFRRQIRRRRRRMQSMKPRMLAIT